MNRRELFKASLLLGASAGLQIPAIKHRLAESPPVKILTPDNTFKTYSALTESFIYSPSQLFKNIVIGKGDSNIWGGSEKIPRPISYLDHLQDFAHQKWGSYWRIYNDGTPGWTTNDVQDQIVSDNDQRRFSRMPSYDMWINVGGNDFMALVETIQKAHTAQRIFENPFSPKTLAYLSQTMNIIDGFGQRFSGLMKSVAKIHGPKIQNLAVVMMPDLGRVKRLDTGLVEGQVFQFPIEDSRLELLLRKLLSNVAIHMNDQMANVLNDLAIKNPKLRIVAINTFNDLDEQPFKEDVHLTNASNQKIARVAIDRCETRTA